jgi:hypothetical protein
MKILNKVTTLTFKFLVNFIFIPVAYIVTLGGIGLNAWSHLNKPDYIIFFEMLEEELKKKLNLSRENLKYVKLTCIRFYEEEIATFLEEALKNKKDFTFSDARGFHPGEFYVFYYEIMTFDNKYYLVCQFDPPGIKLPYIECFFELEEPLKETQYERGIIRYPFPE